MFLRCLLSLLPSLSLSSCGADTRSQRRTSPAKRARDERRQRAHHAWLERVKVNPNQNSEWVGLADPSASSMLKLLGGHDPTTWDIMGTTVSETMSTPAAEAFIQPLISSEVQLENALRLGSARVHDRDDCRLVFGVSVNGAIIWLACTIDDFCCWQRRLRKGLR